MLPNLVTKSAHQGVHRRLSYPINFQRQILPFRLAYKKQSLCCFSNRCYRNFATVQIVSSTTYENNKIMSPAVHEVQPVGAQPSVRTLDHPASKQTDLNPLKQSGILDQFDQFDVTPVIGREFPKASLVEWLRAPNSDELIRNLAITSTFSFRVYVTFHY